MTTLHGGPDALGVPVHDFSTNGNACGPCPQAVAALQACDARHYPDPTYTVLRQQLADFHAVDAWRIVLAGSASEFVYRMTAWVAHGGGHTVSVPLHAYGDYAAAAQAWGLALVHPPQHAALAWACEPSSPLGQAQTGWGPQAAVQVLDCAYAPLRLSGAPSLQGTQCDGWWQLWTPNKALGLTGVRGAYAIAPTHAQTAVAQLNRMGPSWLLGAHAVALLQAWVLPEAQTWLAQSRVTLRHWKQRQVGLCEALGWTCLPSETNFFVARPWGDAAPAHAGAASLAHLRRQGIKLRDATSFGLPGHVRASVLPPAAQDALVHAWTSYGAHR